MGLSVDKYAQVDSALSQVMARIRVNRRSEVLQARLTYGRISAENIRAPSDVPPFPTSHWDGYAVRADDISGASESNPVSLKVVGAVGPGGPPRRTVAHGETVQVGTGAPLPSGADTVVPVESVLKSGNWAVVKWPLPAGSHVYMTGEDMKRGEFILRRGQVIRAQDVGMLISMGLRKTRVRRKPAASVIATGSELTRAGRRESGKVENSHSPIFLRLLGELGCVPVDMGIARDDVKQIARRLRRALAKSDIVLTLGGTSAGMHDYLASSVEALRPDLVLRGVKMDRGRVTGVAVVNGKPVLMMPGPIQGAMNAFLLLGLPIIEVLSGTKGREAEVPCTFGQPWQARSRYAEFRKVVYVKLERGPEVIATPLGAETESMRVLSQADGYVVVPENVSRIEAGEKTTARLLPGFSFA